MASTTTQILLSSSSPSFSTTPWNCEVFISFDSFGNNNRFVEDLRNALEERAIIVLRGDEEMKREERIFQKHSKAIEESRYAVVVISQDYVLSERCLKELTKIMEQRRDRHLKVLPVFHDLDPFDVRNLKGCVEKAFANCIDERVEEELKSWRAAVEEVGDCLVDLPDGGRQRGCLTDSSARNRGDPSVETKPCEECRVDLIEAGQLVGWYVQNRSKLTVIKEISAAIFGGLMRNLPEVPRFLVGMDSVVKEIWGLLHKRSVRDIGNSSDVYYLRICGEKGIGKTTLARVIYEKFSSHFTASCFIPSIGGASGKDIVCLQKYLMSEILTPIEANALNDWDDISEGVELLKSKLCTKKVLIVLDDVYLKEQLEALAGEPMWFGRGSTIIITSEYGYVSLGAIYRIGELNEDDASRLFCSKASSEDTLTLCLPKISFIGSTGMWVFINLPYSWRTSKSSNRRSHWVSIATGSMNVEFSCGARLLNFSNDPKWLLDSGSNPDHVLTEEDSVRLINFSRSRVQRKFHYDSDFYKVIRRVAGHAFNMQFLRDSILGSVTVRGPIKDQKLS